MRHLITVSDLNYEDINSVFKLADSFYEQTEKRPIKKVPLLTGKTIVLLFSEPSTRTRISFELAAKRLSADTLSITEGTSSLKKGESLEDTALTLNEYGVDLMIIRHRLSGAPDRIAALDLFPVVNAGDGKRAHPTQAILDAYTLYKEAGKIKGLKIAIIGDILHSRVARSNFELLYMLGAELYAVAPATMIPEFLPRHVRRLESIDQAIETCDVLYFLRIQFERFQDRETVDVDAYRKDYSLTRDRIRFAESRKVFVMHPGPVNRGIELDPEVFGLERCLILKQVKYGLYVRMAILSYMLHDWGKEIEISD